MDTHLYTEQTCINETVFCLKWVLASLWVNLMDYIYPHSLDRSTALVTSLKILFKYIAEINLALRKPAFQSSGAAGGTADR